MSLGNLVLLVYSYWRIGIEGEFVWVEEKKGDKEINNMYNSNNNKNRFFVECMWLLFIR